MATGRNRNKGALTYETLEERQLLSAIAPGPRAADVQRLRSRASTVRIPFALHRAAGGTGADPPGHQLGAIDHPPGDLQPERSSNR